MMLLKIHPSSISNFVSCDLLWLNKFLY